MCHQTTSTITTTIIRPALYFFYIYWEPMFLNFYCHGYSMLYNGSLGYKMCLAYIGLARTQIDR